VGILANVCAIGTVTVGLFALVPSAILAFLSVVFLAAWFFLIGRQLLGLRTLHAEEKLKTEILS